MANPGFAALVAGLLLAALPLLSVVSHPISVALTIISLACAAASSSRLVLKQRLCLLWQREKPALTLLFVTSAWALATCAWSLEPGYSLEQALRTLPLLLMFPLFYLVLPALAQASARPRFPFWVAGLFIAGCLLLMVDQSFELLNAAFGLARAPSSNNTAAHFISLLVWPVAWMIGRCKTIGGFLVWITAMCAVLVSESQAAQLTMIAGTLVLAIAVALGRAAPWVFGLVALVFYAILIFAGEIATAGIDLMSSGLRAAAAIDHRVEIWQSYYAGLWERPLLGWGFNASRLPSLAGYVEDLGSWASGTSHHPHNVALALWFELGLPGFLLGGIAIIFTFAGVRRLQTSLRPYAITAALVALVHMAVGKHLWQDKWLGGLIALFVLFLLADAIATLRAARR